MEKGHRTGVTEKASWRKCDENSLTKHESVRGRRGGRQAETELGPGRFGVRLGAGEK